MLKLTQKKKKKKKKEQNRKKAKLETEIIPKFPTDRISNQQLLWNDSNNNHNNNLQ